MTIRSVRRHENGLLICDRCGALFSDEPHVCSPDARIEPVFALLESNEELATYLAGIQSDIAAIRKLLKAPVTSNSLPTLRDDVAREMAQMAEQGVEDCRRWCAVLSWACFLLFVAMLVLYHLRGTPQ